MTVRVLLRPRQWAASSGRHGFFYAFVLDFSEMEEGLGTRVAGDPCMALPVMDPQSHGIQGAAGMPVGELSPGPRLQLFVFDSPLSLFSIA